MSRKTAPLGWDAVQATTESLVRETVLLQNMVTFTSAAQQEDTVRRMAGLSAAAHRSWRETNTALTHAFITTVEREDISLLLYRLAALADTLYQAALLWRSVPPQEAAAFTTLLAEAVRLLQGWLTAWPAEEESTADNPATAVYTLRRDGDRLWGELLVREPPTACTAALHRALHETAHLADTALWLALKNT